ncbi:MAG TPA: caspase family protein, partial [Xanthobacteraceae bacterium]|nr:caspase family protein [Xanthobacteraceae bacterium]
MPKRHLPSLLLPVLVVAVLALSVPAHAQTRIALVIGNSAYQKVANLANPAHDAQDVSESLKRLGFTVNTVTDADFDGFRRALRDFGRMAPSADMAVFYFAGHGVEIDGNNWLLPTDAELKSDVDARTEAIGLRSAMDAVATARTLGLVILDACRNNPFSSLRRAGATRSVQMLGLAPVEPADNVLVAYAARDGTVAADGAGRNSPYAAALLKHIETPGLEVDFLFRNIRDDVMAATKNEQQPFIYGSLSSTEIYFKALPAGPAIAGDATPPPDAAEIAWSFLRATNDVSTLTRFVGRFPESSRVSDAKVRIASLATAPAPGATDVPSPPPGQVVAFADTEFALAEKAVARRFVRDTPAVEQAWDIIKETKDHTVIRHFVDRFPSKQRRVVADTRLTALGQKPITVHVAAPQPLDVDENVFAMAAADPD